MNSLSRRALALLAFAIIVPSGPVAAETAAIVDGFRSAKFLMTEEQLRKAIDTDFKGAKIEKRTDPAARTAILSVRIQDLIPDRGIAQINYTLGYKTQKLIQVDVIWNKTIDTKITADGLTSVLANLRQTMIERGFKKDKTVVNATTDRPDVIVFFRGEDDEGRVAAVIGRFKYDPKAEEGKRVQGNEPESVVLSYILNPKSPDMFKLERGKF